jgi:hypothetical protein
MVFVMLTKTQQNSEDEFLLPHELEAQMHKYLSQRNVNIDSIKITFVIDSSKYNLKYIFSFFYTGDGT